MHHTFFQPTNLLLVWLRLVVLRCMDSSRRVAIDSISPDGLVVKRRSLSCLPLHICGIRVDKVKAAIQKSLGFLLSQNSEV